MSVFYNTENLPAFRNPVITIGTFDGVHLGHKAILQQVIQHACEVNGESVLLTFEPHPRKVLFPDQPLELITPLEQKLQLITSEGIDHIVVVPFTKKFADLSAREYIEDFLVEKFKPESIIIGYDHHFGHDRAGDINMLKEYETAFGYKVFEISMQLVDEAAVSSTKIRTAIADGHVEEAAKMLGRDFKLIGKVIKGAQLGRTIGYPTANLQPIYSEKQIPAKGVYAIRAKYKENVYNGMLNIGNRPTVNSGTTLHIETHLFDFSGEIYGETLEVSFVARLRDEQKFSSVEALKEQLHRDKAAAEIMLA